MKLIFKLSIGIIFILTVVTINCDLLNPKDDEFEYGTVKDIDGNVYKTIEIGNQCWMAENLKVKHYRNGDAISNEISDSDWVKLSTGAYSNCHDIATYGLQYNWFAVDDSRNIAPAGWHVPTHDEWITLETYLGGADVAGGKMKEAGEKHWNYPNTGATNESGMTVLPGSGRSAWFTGECGGTGRSTSFWTSTEYYESDEAWCRYLHCNHADIYRRSWDKNAGYCVRCVRD